MPLRLRLRPLREARGLTQQDLAARAGVRRATISDLETGTAANPTLELLGQLCDALDCRPGQLLVRLKPRARRDS